MTTKKKKPKLPQSLDQTDLKDLTSLITNGTIKIANLIPKKKKARKR